MGENGLGSGMITKIEIRSFKSIEHAEIELGQLNVFVGTNGSGKSNILEGFHTDFTAAVNEHAAP